MFQTLKNAFSSPSLSQYQLIPEELTKSDSGDNTTKPQQFGNTDELQITVDHIPGKNETSCPFYVNKEMLNNCPQIPINIGN
jgi:hypothetical protein